jgi:dipeptidase E
MSMKRIVLFSTLTPSNKDNILDQLFPSELKNKVVSYMPSDGSTIQQQYVDEWKGYAERYDASFNVINNCATDSYEERDRLLSSNILVISGGNTFTLLDNLRKSGLDKALVEFAKKDNFVLSGFSAGALVLTPTIKMCNLPNFDDNLVGLTDVTGLGIVDFEVFPHYNELTQKDLLDTYRQTAEHKIREISNEDSIIINL